MAPSTNKTQATDGDRGDILAIAIKLLKSSWKFFILATLGLSIVAVALALLLGQQYVKQINFSATPIPIELRVELGQLPLMTPESTGALAVNYLQSSSLGEIDASSRYNAPAQEVEVTLQSSSRQALNGVVSDVVEAVKAGFQKLNEKNLGTALETELIRLETQIEEDREVLARIEQEIAETPATGAGGAESDGAVARLEALETKRADAIVELASTEAKQREFEQAQEDLPRLADEATSVEVVSESPVSQASSLPYRIALALMSSFLIALLATIVRMVVMRSK